MMSALIPQTVPLQLSGERFRIAYRLGGTEDEARRGPATSAWSKRSSFPMNWSRTDRFAIR